MTDETTHLETRYLGEPAPRRPAVAFFLALLSPGSAWAYVGRMGAGLMLNTAFVALWAGFVFVWATRQFYPQIPFRAFLAGWCVLTLMAAFDARRHARRSGADYVLRETNHPLVYAGIALFTFVLPLLTLHHLATRTIWNVVPVAGDAMYPTLVDGETVLVDVRALDYREPHPGEVVAYELGDDVIRFARVIGLPGDDVAATWDTVFVNDAPATRARVSADSVTSIRSTSGVLEADVMHFVEELEGAGYHIVSPRRGYTAEPMTWSLGADEYLLLNDNRSDSNDSRVFGVVEREHLVGRPVFVETGAAPDREGRRVQPRPSRRGRSSG